MARRQHLTLLVAAVVAVFLTFTYLLSPSSGGTTTLSGGSGSSSKDNGASTSTADLPPGVLSGGAIAPKLENATAKAELGRAAWKLLHTTMARFPEEPTEDESLALKTYVQLFARLYPCGDCARHFQQLLAKYPPQASSRNAAAGWACFVHNQVNKRLKKPEFDCSKIGDFYDCGCGDDKKGAEKKKDGGDKNQEELKERQGVSLEKEEGLTRGG
ncbi:hypothetical protein VTK73DRAFT_8996 [Phialemonium thermophilum]|uniref:Sulfhydryl oxidase n=1 Tax=Phialemonium thermophilum TaxID=223376 RepID=A0ABR3W5B8_9PEZI